MVDHGLIERISRVVAEDHHLEAHRISGGPSEGDQQRLRDLEVQLDQRWDSLR